MYPLQQREVNKSPTQNTFRCGRGMGASICTAEKGSRSDTGKARSSTTRRSSDTADESQWAISRFMSIIAVGDSV